MDEYVLFEDVFGTPKVLEKSVQKLQKEDLIKLQNEVRKQLETTTVKPDEKRIEKAALIISQRVMDEWYGGEEFPEDCQLFEEILCGLLQDNPEECEKLIGTAFCEEEEIEE